MAQNNYVVATNKQSQMQLDLLATKRYFITMPDDSVWAVPVMFIAQHRAKFYAEQNEIPITESLEQDTVPLFVNKYYRIGEWARCQMKWFEVRRHATQVVDPTLDADYESGWANGPGKIVGTEDTTFLESRISMTNLEIS